MTPLRILILGGTAEASALAEALRPNARCAPILSLAGATRAPRMPTIEFRVGGFGGIDGLVRYLEQQRIDVLVVATHPFAAQIRANAIAAARILQRPLLLLHRPPWQAQAGDRWQHVPDTDAAAAALGASSKRVWLTIGRKELAAFAAHPHHYYMIRTIDPPLAEHLPPNAELVSARGPFSEADEARFIQTHRVEVLVTKNSGGTATEAKLAAARARGVPVIMIERPPIPPLDSTHTRIVHTVADALQDLESRHHERFSIERGV